ncbi:MAG: radical SAM protein, partial [Candidatus Aenigmarchaeota archaeon]|nr:radical SAM protein [Candidatus Aenigmarchaeota archaeon]
TFMTQGDTHGHENNKVFSYQIKKEEPTIITVLGGVGAKSLNVLSKGEHVEGLDYCVMGDGERIFEKIIKENERPNKTKYLEDIIYDLDSLEFPKRKAFDTERYIKILQKVNTLNRNERYLNIFTSKGCDWGKCTFCTVDRHYRTKSPEKIRAEVEYLVEEFKITKLFTCDDNFFCYKDPERTYRICETLQKFPYLKWSVGETRVTDFVKNVNLGKKILRKMRGSGCVEINWGAESGDPQLLKNMQKGISPSDIEMAIRMTTEAGMISKLLLMYNLPGETKESLDNTLNFVKNLLVKYPINFLKVSEYANIPGTIDWYRGHNSDVSKTDVEGFMSELSDFCSVNNIVLSFLNWERTGDEKSSCRI